MTLPIGYAVTAPVELVRPKIDLYQGKIVSLAPVNSEQDIEELFECSHGSTEFEQPWTYMPYGPFTDSEQMRKQYLNNCAVSTDPLFLA